jgi:iron-sulfur cluster repair protein YtfE (RIC family)
VSCRDYIFKRKSSTFKELEEEITRMIEEDLKKKHGNKKPNKKIIKSVVKSIHDELVKEQEDLLINFKARYYDGKKDNNK